MRENLTIEGHAIVSADGMIADADGLMPEALRNDADFAQFQAALDRAVLVILGRHGHTRHPNRNGRRRLVLTSTIKGFEQHADAAFWNPADASLEDVLARMDIRSGTLAVTGGQKVFGAFLSSGYDTFTLVEVEDYVLPSGIACFTAGHPRQVLAAHGLVPGDRRVLSGPRPTLLTQWRKGSHAGAATSVETVI